MRRNEQLAAQIVLWGADLSLVDSRSMTALMHAAHNGSKALVQQMLAKGANVCECDAMAWLTRPQQSMKDCDGWLAVDHALVGDHVEVAALFAQPAKQPAAKHNSVLASTKTLPAQPPVPAAAAEPSSDASELDESADADVKVASKAASTANAARLASAILVRL